MEKDKAVVNHTFENSTRFYRPAPAKVNLFLHVRNRRSDGYHNLESLVAFTDVCDDIEVEKNNDLELVISGPFADSLSNNKDNLIIQAARLLAKFAEIKPKARIFLRKALPVAAGIGGGSSDAAATLLALRDLWQISIKSKTLHEQASELGADVPVCLTQGPRLVRGIGHDLTIIKKLPTFALVLANPRYPLYTSEVFRCLTPPFPTGQKWDRRSTLNFYSQLVESRNDLEPVACKLAPVVSRVLAELKNLTNCRLARMSGSGTTCYGLFDDIISAELAAQKLHKRQKNWWVKACAIRSTNV